MTEDLLGVLVSFWKSFYALVIVIAVGERCSLLDGQERRNLWTFGTEFLEVCCSFEAVKG